MNREAASAIRKRLDELQAERRRLEEPLFDAQRLLRGSLVEKSQLAGGEKRHGPAYYYLSVPLPGGRHVLKYVPRSELDGVRKDNNAYRRYRKAVSRLRVLSKQIVKEFDALGKCLEVPLP
jgi:hypothetical protein